MLGAVYPTNYSSSRALSTSQVANLVEVPNDDPFLGIINLYFSMWVGVKEEIGSEMATTNIHNSTIWTIQLTKLKYAPLDGEQISRCFHESFNDLRHVIELTLCTGTDIEIISNIDKCRNICDPLEQGQVSPIRGKRTEAKPNFTSYDNAYVGNQSPQNITRILSNEVDTIFHLTDKRNKLNNMTWVEFKVSFPVISVNNTHEQIFSEEEEVENLIGLIETISNIALSSSIMRGKFDHMFREYLKLTNKTNILIITSPVGKEESLFSKKMQEMINLMEKRGRYPYPLGTTFFSFRQIVGASLIALTYFFIYALRRKAASRPTEQRETEQRETEQRNSLHHCGSGPLTSDKRLDFMLEISAKILGRSKDIEFTKIQASD